MKIRTDFVTNSSSSNFTVTLEIKTKDGKTLTKEYGDGEYEGGSTVDVYGGVQEILNATTVGELIEALQIDDGGYEDEEWYGDEDEDSESIEGNEDAQLKTATLKRSWSATGEWSSTFGYNVDEFLPDLKGLCQKVLDTDGDEKEQAKKDLMAYLDNVGDLNIVSGGGEWPSNLCRGNGINKINWKGLAKKIEKFAEMVVNGELPTSSDRGEEILKFDFAKKKYEASNIYYIE